MISAERVLAVARAELGTVEAADGSNKYGRAYGMDRVAWCAEFVWWCFREAGGSLLIHPKTAYTPTLAQWFRDRQRFDTTPQVGDVLFFDWPDSVRRIQHVGIVEAVEAAAVVTIEGNTAGANQSDGGRVMRRRRARNSSIVGYGHPAYLATSAATSGDGDAELNAEETRMLRECHRELTTRLPNRVDYALLGRPTPNPRPDDTAYGKVLDADARAYETRELVRALRTDLTAMQRLIESQQGALEALARMAGQGGGSSAEQIKAAVAEALRENLVRVDVAVAGRGAES